MANNYNENAIREAAYYIWQKAGCPSGMESQHWAMAMDQLYNCKCSKSACSSNKKSSSSSSKKTTTASAAGTSSATKKSSNTSSKSSSSTAKKGSK